MNMALNRLGERDGEALVHKLASNAALTAEIVAEIVERTDGVPLFVEELTKAVLEGAVQPTGSRRCSGGHRLPRTRCRDLACLTAGAPRSPRADARDRADWRRARPRVFL